MSRTALNVLDEAPGWWVEFLAAVVKSLPRPGEIDQTTALGWANNQAALKKVLAGQLLPPSEQSAKFALLVDLGIITVPDDYDHATALDKFLKKNRENFCGVNDNITDKNFPNPTRVLNPGDKLRVRAFKQVVGGTTTSEERLAFLATQKAIHTGAQGLSLVFDQKRDQLPKVKEYASFDEPDRLWKGADGDRRVPGVAAHSSGDFFFWRLGSFGDVWGGDYAFLCFCDLPAQAGLESA